MEKTEPAFPAPPRGITRQGKLSEGEASQSHAYQEGTQDEGCQHLTLHPDTSCTQQEAGQTLFTALLPEPKFPNP